MSSVSWAAARFVMRRRARLPADLIRVTANRRPSSSAASFSNADSGADSGSGSGAGSGSPHAAICVSPSRSYTKGTYFALASGYGETETSADRMSSAPVSAANTGGPQNTRLVYAYGFRRKASRAHG